jgi:hypothetical protein
VQASSPLCFTGGLLEDVVSAVEMHDAVLQAELPLVAGTSDLVVLTNDHLQWKLFLTLKFNLIKFALE